MAVSDLTEPQDMGTQEFLEKRIADLERRLAVAVEALKAVQRELGVPQPGYPAPVAHAYEIAKFGVEQIGEKEKGNLAPPTEVER